MAKKLKISLKYKFLLVLLSTLALGFSTFFALAYRTFSEDKKLFVMELNLSILKTAISDTRADLKSRVDELQTFLPKIYEISTPISNVIFRELSLQHLPNELLGVRFYRKNLTDASFTLIKDFKNTDLFQNRSLADSVLEQIDRTVPPQLETFSFAEGTKILNRSIKTSGFSGVVELPVITFLVSGSFVNDSSKSVVIVVDLVQDFLRKKLSQSELAEVFLISKNGMLISHSSTSKLLQNSQKIYSHPIVEKLKTRQLPRESLELKIGSENYLCNLSETGFADVYAISQIKESEAFQALKTLMKETLLTGIFVFSIALIISIIFSNKLTANIKKLKMGAQSIGRGDFEVKLNIKSNDEIQNVADSFNWMASRIKQLITETVTKERMEKELETAKLIQSTLLSSTHINTDAAEVEPFYLSASECGGDIWDAYQTGTTLTVLVGDATGHGAAAAIVTAVAKSCFITLNSVYSSTPLSPKSFLEQLNQVIYGSCKGQLLMTMSVLQIDLSSGKALLSNAGHEAPLLLKAPTTPEHKNKCEPLFVRGERLGFAPDSKFENLEVQLGIGDTVLIYTDGISEAVNLEKKPFGERGIRKLFNRLGSEPLPEIKTQLFKELKDFMGETEQQDDITFLLVKWHHQLESQNPAPDSLYNKGESQRVISTPPPVLPPTEQKISLNELAKTSDFNEEEVDTHYSRIEDLENQDNDSSEGEAA